MAPSGGTVSSGNGIGAGMWEGGREGATKAIKGMRVCMRPLDCK
jgi:hypothetical protein